MKDDKDGNRKMADYFYGIVRMIKYKTNKEIELIYEGFVEGPDQFTDFGRMIQDWGSGDYIKAVGWWQWDAVYNFAGRGIFYHKEELK